MYVAVNLLGYDCKQLFEIFDLCLDDAPDGSVETVFGDLAALHGFQEAVVDGSFVRVVVADEHEVCSRQDRFEIAPISRSSVTMTPS